MSSNSDKLPSFLYSGMDKETLLLSEELQSLGGGDAKASYVELFPVITPVSSLSSTGGVGDNSYSDGNSYGNGSSNSRPTTTTTNNNNNTNDLQVLWPYDKVLGMRDSLAPRQQPISETMRYYPVTANYNNNSLEVLELSNKLTNWLIDGFNACVVSIANSNSQKTDTLFGTIGIDTVTTPCLATRLINDLFQANSNSNSNSNSNNSVIKIGISAWMLHQNNLVDLIAPVAQTAIPLDYVTVECSDSAAACRILADARGRLPEYSNSSSNRNIKSNFFMRIILYRSSSTNNMEELYDPSGSVSCLHLVDVAELVDVESAEYNKQSENVKIAMRNNNKQVATLFKVLNEMKLASQKALQSAQTVFSNSNKNSLVTMTSARDSKLTSILGPIIQGNTKTVILAFLNDGVKSAVHTQHLLTALDGVTDILSACHRVKNVKYKELNFKSYGELINQSGKSIDRKGPMPSVAIPATYLPTDKISPSSPSINYSASVDTSLQENSMDFGDLDLEKVLRGDFYKPSRKSPRLKMRPNDSKPNFYQSNFVDLNHINEQLMESNKKSENKEYQLINPNQNQSIPWANDSNQNGLNVSLTSTEFPTTKPISGRASSNDSVNSARSDIDKIMDEFHDLMEEIQHTEATADVHTPLKKPKRIIDNYLSCNKHSNSSSCHKENSNEHNESIKQSSSFVDVVSNNVKQHLRGSQHQHDKYTTSFEARKFDEKYNSGRNISEMVHYNHDSSNSAIQATWSAEQAPRSQHAIYDTLETADSSKSYALRSRGGVIASSYNEINLKPNEQLRSSALQEKGIHDVYSPPFPTSNHINSSADIDDFVIEGLREMQKTANREDYLILQKEIDRIFNINTISSDNQDTDFVDSCDNTSNSVKESEKATETPITSNLKYSSSEYDLAASSKVRKEPKSYKDFEENTEEKRSVRSSNSSISHADSLANSIDASFEEVEGNKIELDKYESDVALQIKQSNDGSDTKKRRLGDVFHSKFVESTKVVLPSEKDLVGCSSIDDSSTKRYLMGLTASVGSLDEAIENEKDNISRSNNRKSTDPLEALYFSTDRKVIPATVPTGESGRIEPLKNESVLDPKNYEANIPQGFDSILAAEQEIEMLKRTNSSLMESLREERNARLKLENVHKASQDDLLEVRTQCELEIDNYKIENIKLKNQLREVTQNNSMSDVFASFEENISRLVKENEALRRSNLELEAKEFDVSSSTTFPSRNRLYNGNSLSIGEQMNKETYLGKNAQRENLRLLNKLKKSGHERESLRKELEELKRKERQFLISQKIAQDASRRLKQTFHELVKVKKQLDSEHIVHNDTARDLMCIKDDTRDLRESESRLREERGKIISELSMLRDRVRDMDDERHRMLKLNKYVAKHTESPARKNSRSNNKSVSEISEVRRSTSRSRSPSARSEGSDLDPYDPYSKLYANLNLSTSRTPASNVSKASETVVSQSSAFEGAAGLYDAPYIRFEDEKSLNEPMETCLSTLHEGIITHVPALLPHLRKLTNEIHAERARALEQRSKLLGLLFPKHSKEINEKSFNSAIKKKVDAANNISASSVSGVKPSAYDKLVRELTPEDRKKSKEYLTLDRSYSHPNSSALTDENASHLFINRRESNNSINNSNNISSILKKSSFGTSEILNNSSASRLRTVRF